MRVLHEVKSLQGTRYERRQEGNRRHAPFSLVLGAKTRGHRVREYEKIRNEAMPMDNEIII